MAQSIPGRRARKEYVPRNLRVAMAATRMANAYRDNVDLSCPCFRYITSGVNIHEAIDPDREIQVLDTVDGTLLSVPELLQRLPENLRNHVLSS
jgi:hypothetical protein